jgi:hypothetical protein
MSTNLDLVRSMISSGSQLGGPRGRGKQGLRLVVPQKDRLVRRTADAPT